MIYILIVLLLLFCGSHGISLLMTSIPSDDPAKSSKLAKENFFLTLALKLSNKKPARDYLLMTVANPYDKSNELKEAFLLDTGSDYYVISQSTYDQLDLVTVGTCDVVHFGSAT